MEQFSPLRASFEKVNRAKVKFDRVKSAVNAFIADDRHSVRFEHDAKRTYMIARVDKDIPEDVAWEIVEAVGHLRSALDKAIVELVDLNGFGSSGAAFPFGGQNHLGQADPFPSARNEFLKKKLTSDQWELILATKPYPGGNDTLWSINQIANADKHRKGLVEVVCRLRNEVVVGVNKPAQARMTIVEAEPSKSHPVLKDKERETMVLSFGRDSFNYKVDCTLNEEIVFGNITPVHGKNVLPVLNQQIRMVERVIKSFRVFF